MEITFDGKSVFDAVTELRTIVQRNLPRRSGQLYNCLVNPLGEYPARGSVCVRRADLNTLDLNGEHTLTFEDDFGNTFEATGLIVTNEPGNLVPGKADDPKAVFAVDLADKRFKLAHERLGVALNKQYNVLAPGYNGDYYADSLDSGSAYTWDTMCSHIWTQMAAILGAYPSLPFTPDGTPEGWKFPGVNAWWALNRVLEHIGCAVKWKPQDDTYTIVQVGTGTDDLDAAEDMKIFDREFQDCATQIPGKVVVYFHITEAKRYGEELTTMKTSSQTSTHAVYEKEITGPDADADSNVKHPLWASMLAHRAIDGTTITNQAACDTHAQAVADRFYAQITDAGGGRLHRIYAGVAKNGASVITPGGKIKGVAWRQDLEGINTGAPGGIITEAVRHPYWTLRADAGDFEPACCFASVNNQPPQFGPTYQNYPHIYQKIRLTTGTANGSGLFTAKVQQYDSTARTWSDKEDCWAIEQNGATTLTSNRRYDGRLSGHDTTATAAPVYTINGASGGYSWPSTGLTVREVDLAPSVTGVTTIEFDQDDGFTVTNPATGVARIDLPQDADRGCVAYHSTTQTITAGNEAALEADSEDYDTDTVHDNVTNNTRMTFTTIGTGRFVVTWSCKATVTFAGVDKSPEWFEVYCRKNGSGEVTGSRTCAPFWRQTAIPNSTATAATSVELDHNCLNGAFMVNITNAADYIEMMGDATANTMDVTTSDFMFSVHKLNRAANPA